MASSKIPEAEPVPYETPAKVLFSGLGADEQVRPCFLKIVLILSARWLRPSFCSIQDERMVWLDL